MRSTSILLLLCYLVMSVALFYVAAKTDRQGKRRFWLLNGIILLVGAILCAVNAAVLSVRLMALGMCVPMGLFLVLLGADTVRDFHRCHQPVEARCIGSQRTSHRGMVIIRPKFRYRYDGRLLEGLGLDTYSKSAFDRLLEKDEPLTVHIDPDRPLICVHKPGYRFGNTVFLIILGALFLLFGAVIAVFG